ncbi:MAG: Ldh family oxidoreductase, partial [Rhodospirillales bacterium]|nr:Ldh family oxidoreductase [Rhodospirillales bacterium]
ITRGEEYSGQKHASQYFQAVKIENFTPLDDFKADMDRMIQAVRNSRPREDVERIYLPGEIEWLKKAAWMERGIPLHKGHVENLEKMADELGARVPWR